MSALPTITLTFDGPIMSTPDQPARLTVLGGDPGGEPILEARATQTGVNVLESAFPADTPPGAYRLTFAVASFDGDLNTGDVEFRYDPTAPDATNCAPVEESASGSVVRPWLVSGGAVVVVAGGALARWRMIRRRDDTC